jgi:phospholipase C
MAHNGSADPIEHVIVLMFENRSFDHMLGILPGVDGVDLADPRGNRESLDPSARVYRQAPVATTIDLDPPHDVGDVRTQLTADGSCGGFVIDFAHEYPNSTPGERQEVMNYFPRGAVPALHALAEAFTVCDRWFSSVPGPTWTNRFFVHSGTSLGKVAMPSGAFPLQWHFYDQTTVYDRLNDAGKEWRIYYGDVPQSLLLVHQWAPQNAARYRPMNSFYTDCQADAAAFPALAFIEPSYFGAGQTDQHPATDVRVGDGLLARVYNAIRANDALWRSTLLLILYDEHGGFYDHVLPGAAVPPDEHHDEYSFDQFGVRVPAVLVSPWVKKGVLSSVFDHTSLLRYLSDKWALGPLGLRTAAANSFAGAVGATLRTDTPASLPVTPAHRLAAPRPAHELNEFQQALLGFTQVLDVKTLEPADHKVVRLAQILEGPGSQADVARERVENFLAQQRRLAATKSAPIGKPTGPTRAGKRAGSRSNRARRRR